ncbi:MAG: DUF342 domain-containing protein, partial [Brevinema sp.]
PVVLEDILTELTAQGYKDFNKNLCQKALSSPQKTFIIAPYIKFPDQDATFSITISQDEMSVSIIIDKPKGQGCIPDPQEILSALKKNNVVHGINDQYIEEILDHNLFNVVHIIAKGTEIELGHDAHIEYHFMHDSENIKHAVREDGSINFKELNIIHNVHNGDILATKHSATPGKDGKTVTGRILPTTQGKDIEWQIGPNVTISPDKKHAIASSAGQVYIKDKKLFVDPALEISSDVDLSVGNIDFLGNVIIKGNVTDGFSVISGGNIEIHGHIGKCFIHAAGNIIAHQGIQGKDENRIECSGDLYARFVERSNVFVGGNIFITKALLHSHVICEKNVYVFGSKKAIIAGGNIKAQKEIICRQLGAESYIETHLEVGYSQQLLTEIGALQNLLLEKEKKINSMKEEFAATNSSLSIDKSITFEKQILQQVENRKISEQKLTEKRKLLYNLQHSCSISSEQFMPGLKIKIASSVLDISLVQSKGSLILKDHAISFGKYRPSDFFMQMSIKTTTNNKKNKK